MRDLTKAEKQVAKEIIRRGILHRHSQWQKGLKELIDKPFEEGCNEFDRSLEITDNARKFFKEAMKMEDYYRNSQLVVGLACLYQDHHITDKDIAELTSDIQQTIRVMLSL